MRTLDLSIQPMDYLSLENAGLGLSKVGMSIVNGGKLTFSGEDVYFDVENPEILWSTKYVQLESEFKLRTLRFLSSPLLNYEKSGDKSSCVFFEKFLKSFLCLMKPHNSIRKLPSEDHALYIRTVLFIKALMVFPETWELREELVDLVIRQGKWMLDDNNYRKNNHGVMMDLGLLHLSALFREHSFSTQYRERALERIKEMFVESFDADGFHNENTIMYLNFNLKLYKEITYFCNHYAFDSDIRQMFNDTIQKAEEALQYLVWQDGTIPPIGDGGQSKSGYESINASKFFKNGNFALVKDDDTYFSLKCGWTTFIHKHVDEASITLRYKNEDLLIDSGKFNYDNNGPRPKLVSFAGHSTIYPLKYENTQLKEMIKQYASAEVSFYGADEKSTKIQASYSLEKGAIVVARHVDCGNGFIEMLDEWKCEKLQLMRQRFIIPGNAIVEELAVTNGGYAYLITNNSQRMRIGIVNSSVSVAVRLTRGVVSPVDFKLADAWFLDIDAEKSMAGQIKTEILFGDKTKGMVSASLEQYDDAAMLQNLREELMARSSLLYNMQNSVSWRITKPLRACGIAFRRAAKKIRGDP